MLFTNTKQQFELPKPGSHRAVLADIIDLGVVTTQFGDKHRVRFRWLLETLDARGKHLSAIATYNIAWSPKSALYGAVRAIIGREPGARFDSEALIGANANLVIEHQESGGRTWANIAAILRPEPGAQRVEIPPTFRRRGAATEQTADTDRFESYHAKTPVPATPDRPVTTDDPISDADIPF